MRSPRSLAALAGITLLFAGCMHQQQSQGVSSGDVAVDSLTATRTAILRIQNNYPSEVRVYSVVGGQANYIAKAMPGETRTWVMDPNLFPASSISFEARPADGKPSHSTDPLKVNKGETVELVIPATLENTRATVHRSTP
jgi:hypothetical protein